MLLSDGTLRKMYASAELDIVPPLKDEQFQPCSIDLRLGNHFRVPGNPGVYTDVYSLTPGSFALGTTLERVGLGTAFVGQVHGRSTWARRGLQVHAAGLIDPGFSGQITLEFVNLGTRTILLTAGERICQMTVERLDWPSARPYGHKMLGSHYQYQSGATPAHE